MAFYGNNKGKEEYLMAFIFFVFSMDADIRTAKISRLSTQLRRQLHQLRRTLRTRWRHHKDLVASGSVLVKAIHSNSSACVDSLLENSKRSRKTRSDSISWGFMKWMVLSSLCFACSNSEVCNSQVTCLFVTHRAKPSRCVRKTCAFSQGDVQCDKKAFPYTKFCKDRIFSVI